MKFIKKLVIIIIIIFIILLMVFLWYKLTNKKQNINIEEKNVLTPDGIIELLSYIPYSLINIDGYKSAYCGERVTSEDILPVILSPYFMSNHLDNYGKDNSDFEKKLKTLNMEYGSVYLIKDVDDFLMEKYNLKLSNMKDISNRIKIVKLDSKYVAFSIVKTGNFALLFKVLISVMEAYDIDDMAIVTERELFYEFKDNKYYVYKNSNATDKDIIKVYDKKDSNGKELSYEDIFNKIKEDFKDYNYGFKHTYKKNDTGYYWYSTEFVEIK